VRLHLVRHGQTFSNLASALDTGAPGAALTPEGERQARAVGAALADRPLGQVLASGLDRARATAAEVARPHGLDVLVRDGLREVLAGDLEMRTDPESVQRYLGTMAAWASGDLAAVMPGGESGRQTLDRFDAVVAEILALGSDEVAVVSHGAMIRLWSATRAVNLTGAAARDRWLDNTGVVTLEHDPGADVRDGWVVTHWQDEAVPHPSSVPGDGPGGRPVDA
jgi:probable phosphoglycerate mutase